MSRPRLKAITLALVTTCLALCLTVACGRSPSRILGKGARQVVEIAGMKSFVSISFDKRGESTVKDITFVADDGYVYTQEFKDLSPLEGAIRWVPFGEGDSFIQSRSLSRMFAMAVELELPEDCDRVLGVDVTYEAQDERRKNLTYLSKQGQVLSREYREGMVDRHLEGWLEIKRK